jgi:hypothetical protein
LLDVLGRGEVLTSDELITKLTDGGVGKATARQTLSRAVAAHEVWRSEHFRLPRNGRIFARHEFVGTDAFFLKAIAKISARPGIARCLEALGQRSVLLLCEAQKLLASPCGTTSNKFPTFESECQALSEFGVAQGSLLGGWGYLSSHRTDPEVSNAIALNAVSRLRIECILARIVVDQLRKQNVLSWHKFNVSPAGKGFVVFNDQPFTAFGYSYLRPVVRWQESKAKGCPVLFDVSTERYDSVHLNSFLERIRRATCRGESQQRYFGVIAAPQIETEAWRQARKQNLWTINLQQAFGKEAIEALAQIERLLRALDPQVSKFESNAATELQTLLLELKTNPVVATLRAIGLEAVCALVLRNQGFDGVEIGRLVPFEGTTREVDVFGFRWDELRIVECKAISGGGRVYGAEVKKFFSETVPAFIRWYRSTGHSFRTVTAEIWTTGEVDATAIDSLKEVKLQPTTKGVILNLAEVLGQIPQALRPRINELVTTIAARGSPIEEPIVEDLNS